MSERTVCPACDDELPQVPYLAAVYVIRAHREDHCRATPNDAQTESKQA
jgi:hypothetical protein